MTKTTMTVAVCATLLWIGTAQATASAQQKCEQAKLKAQGALQACLEKNAAGVVGGKAAATSCRYLDNGDGTVSDLKAGLMWEQKANLDGLQDYSNPEDADNTYARSAAGEAKDGSAFIQFLSALNNGASTDGGATTAITGCFANHCDWRLPSIVELQGILDLSATGCGSGSPCINPAFGPTRSDYYWSATPYAGEPGGAWFVHFYNGGVAFTNKACGGYVRAVRCGL